MLSPWLQLLRLIYREEAKCYFCLNKHRELYVPTEKSLRIHHINGDRSNNKKSNLMILCRSCHSKLHWIYAKLGIKERGKRTMTTANYSSLIRKNDLIKGRVNHNHFRK